MRSSKMTPPNILSTLNKHMGWTMSTSDRGLLTYAAYKRVLMDLEEPTAQERMCREKWKKLQEFGYFRQVNKTSVTVDVCAVGKKLENHVPPRGA